MDANTHTVDCNSALKRTPCHTQQRERTWRTSGSRRAKPLQSCPTLRLCGTQPTRLLCPRRFSRQEYWSGSPLCDVKEARQSRANPARSHLLAESEKEAGAASGSGGFWCSRGKLGDHLSGLRPGVIFPAEVTATARPLGLLVRVTSQAAALRFLAGS